MRKAIVSGISIIIASIFVYIACGKKVEVVETEKVVEQDKPLPDCDGIPLGSQLVNECQDGYEGQLIRFCTVEGWKDLDLCLAKEPSCDDTVKFKVTFEEDLKDIIEKKCSVCHTDTNYADYEIAKKTIDKMIYRINLGTGDLARMPKPPQPELEQSEKQIFEKWKLDGLLKDKTCAGGVDPNEEAFYQLDLDYIEARMLNHLRQIGNRNAQNTRFLIISNQYNLNPSNDDYREFMVGINKGLNLLNLEEEYIYPATPIDDKKSIFALDLSAFGLDNADWQNLEDRDPVNFISNTVNGQLIQDLTGTEKPWLHAENFLNLAFGEPDIYYDIINAPETFDQLMVDNDVNYDANLSVDFQALLVGFFGSEISLNKNRLIARYDSKHGSCWVTYDPLEVVDESNLFERFLLYNSTDNFNSIFRFDGSEVICANENGGHSYYLFNANGIRIDEAPIDLVVNTKSPFQPIIINARSCLRCHTSGFIKAQDSIRDHLLRNGSQFNSEDLQVGLELYKGNTAANAAFVNDNSQFGRFLNAVGGDSFNDDPVNHLVDRFRADYTLDKAAALVLLSPEDMTKCINTSQALSADIGQLTTGGTVGVFQLFNSLPNVFADCRIGEDPLGR